MLKINCYAKQEYFIVELDGVLTIDSAYKFDNEVTEMIKLLGVNNLKINFNNLIYIDEIGLAKIINCYSLVEKCF